MVRKKGGNRAHLESAVTTERCMLRSGKDDSLPKRNLIDLSQLVGHRCDELLPGVGLWFHVQDGQLRPGKGIEEAYASSCMLHWLGGGYSSVGRAPLLQLGRCDYGLDV
ncbi:hypothetical protein Tco_1277700 [Tanacetum coccineum]